MKTLFTFTFAQHKLDHIRVALEFKKEDLWVGAFWRTERNEMGRDICFRKQCIRIRDVWVCFLPCLPIHLTFVRMVLL